MPFDPQTYRLASIARDKLCREAARASHDLRVLVAHANILDELLIVLNAPGGGFTEYYGFDLQPQEVHTARTPRRNVVVTINESSQHELDDEVSLEHSSHLSSDSASGLPMLSHDSESDSDSASDSDDSDDSDDFSSVITPTSPTGTNASMSLVEEDGEPDEAGLGLHRTKSVWRLFGASSPSSEERQKRKSTKPIDVVTSDIEQLGLSTV